MSNTINIVRHKLLTLNSPIFQNNFLLSKQSHSIIEDYFNFFIQNNPTLSNNKIDNNHNDLFHSYSAFFSKLLKTAFEIKCDITETITRKVSTYFQLIKKQRNTVLIKYGTQSSDFYVILNGKVDIIAPIEQTIELYEKDYLRYLAYLIEYEEYDIINRVLRNNIDNFYLEIINSNKFWKMPYLYKSDNNKIPTYISIDNLLKELSVKEKNFFYNKRANRMFSTDDYLNIYDNIQKGRRYIDDKKISVKICLFRKITELIGGDYFGHNGGHDRDIINSIYITSKSTEFAYLDKEMFSDTIKPIMKMIHQEEIKYLHSFELFEKLSYEAFEMKYANAFIKQQEKKGARLLCKNNGYKCLLLLKKGEYEVTTMISLKEIIEHIMYLNERLQEEDCLKYQQQIIELREKNKHFNRKAKKCPITNAFYTNQKEIKVLSLQAKEIVLNVFCSKEDIYLFNVILNSPEGEYYCIDKDIYCNIKSNECYVNQADAIIARQNTITILERLIDICYLKIKYFTIHNKEIIKKINNLSCPTIQLKTIFSIPKRTPKPKRKNESTQSLIQFAIEPKEEEEPSYRETKVIFPSVEKEQTKTKTNNSTNDFSCIKKEATTSTNYHHTGISPNRKQEEPLSFKKLVYEGLMKNPKHYFKNNHHNVTGLIDIAYPGNSLEGSNEPLIDSVGNYFSTQKFSQRLLLHNTLKEKLFRSNRKTEHTSFLNYLTFKTVKPIQMSNKNSKNVILKYSQPLKRSISQSNSSLHNSNHSLLFIKNQKEIIGDKSYSKEPYY